MIKKLFVISLMIGLLMSCSTHSQSIPLKTEVQAVSYLNPDENNRPSPLVVTFYQLKNGANFEQADFFSLYNDATNTLGNSLIDKTQAEIRPNQTKTIHIDLSKRAKYIGIVAAYRNTNQARWRRIIQIPKQSKGIKLAVQLQSQGLVVSNPQRGKACVGTVCLF